jgi:hypothetical protein
MLKNRTIAAQRVADDFLVCEPLIDQAAAAIAQLYNTMFNAKADAHLGIHVGRDAFNLVAQAIYHQSQARDQLLAAHAALAATRKEVLPGRMAGDEDCPNLAPSGLRLASSSVAA